MTSNQIAGLYMSQYISHKQPKSTYSDWGIQEYVSTRTSSSSTVRFKGIEELRITTQKDSQLYMQVAVPFLVRKDKVFLQFSLLIVFDGIILCCTKFEIVLSSIYKWFKWEKCNAHRAVAFTHMKNISINPNMFELG